MTDQKHQAKELLTGPTFYHFDHFVEIEGVMNKIVAVHRPDTSTEKYWEDRGASDILLSVRPVERFGLGDMRKHMVHQDAELIAKAAA